MVSEGQNRCWKGKLLTPQNQVVVSPTRMSSTQWLAKTSEGFRRSPWALHQGKGCKEAFLSLSKSSRPKKSQVLVMRCPSETKNSGDDHSGIWERTRGRIGRRKRLGCPGSGPGLLLLTLQDSHLPGAHLQGHHRIPPCRFPTPFTGHTRG